jgi:hypothetical protein
MMKHFDNLLSTSTCGATAWSLTAEAVFFRNLVKGSPFLIDWLLTSCSEDKQLFRKLVASFMACQNVVGRKVGRCRLTRLNQH